MSEIKNPISFPIVLGIVKLIYKQLQPWLREEAKKTSTPVDDWMLDILDKLLMD